VRPYLFDGYWADVGTIDAFYEANVLLGKPDAPFRYWDPLRPIYTQLGHLPGARLFDCHVRESIVSDGCDLHRCAVDQSVIGLRTRIGDGSRIGESVILGADFYEDGPPGQKPRLGVGRDVVLRRTIVDKNARIGDGARLVNEKGLDHFDGEGYFIRSGIIVVPKGGAIAPGTIV
jgi:glucose-1-phosphate adenylyltransferase